MMKWYDMMMIEGTIKLQLRGELLRGDAERLKLMDIWVTWNLEWELRNGKSSVSRKSFIILEDDNEIRNQVAMNWDRRKHTVCFNWAIYTSQYIISSSTLWLRFFRHRSFTVFNPSLRCFHQNESFQKIVENSREKGELDNKIEW